MNREENKKILIYAKKIKLINSIGGCCKICNESNHFKLTFHHLHDKEFRYGEARWLRFSKLKNEIDKCIILCQNCHRELHYNESSNTSDLRRNDKLIYLEYSGSNCIKCGYSKCPASLTFHHRDPKSKLFSIGNLSERIISIYELGENIKNELNKCDILCANCHVMEHSDVNFFELYKSEIEERVKNYKEIQPKIDREEVMMMYNNGIRQFEIANFFKASRGTISDIVRKYKNGG